MNKTNSQPQKKRTLYTCIYALIIGLVILACAIIIATISTQRGKTNQEVGGSEDLVEVSGSSYVVPMFGATVCKDYSSTKLQFNNSLKQWEIHKAVDFLVGEDANVAAIHNGTVSKVYKNHLEGTVIVISHSNGLESIYKSLSENVKVKVGDVVSAGQLIGTASDSMAEEQAMGAHLHLEIHLNGDPVDPNNYLSLGNK